MNNLEQLEAITEAFKKSNATMKKAITAGNLGDIGYIAHALADLQLQLEIVVDAMTPKNS